MITIADGNTPRPASSISHAVWKWFGLTASKISPVSLICAPGERARIVSAKGRVFALADEPHLPRVWVPHEMLPGLAMSRSLGDLILKPYGVSAEPEITQRRISGKDRFAVLASDGVRRREGDGQMGSGSGRVDDAHL